LAVGFTFIYALSGLAVNHIADWDPNFRQENHTYHLGTPLGPDDDAIATRVLRELKSTESPSNVYRVAADRLDIVLARRTLHVNTRTGLVDEEGQAPRFFLRAANFLHLNRGKKAWTAVADTYAVFLLYLACSGLFMIPGRKGIRGRGAVLASLGALIPALYVLLSRVP
jgi:hypothetical protein